MSRVDPTVRRKIRSTRVPKLTCARCETRLADPSRRLYSVHTKLHFCSDIDECSRRAARKLRMRAAA